ncbi:MAG: metal ABC transporter permease [Beijerinckiaceae bacterium]
MNAILGFFLDPLTHGFMQRGLMAALLVALVCAMLSCYLILKGWSLMGDAVSHAVLPGIVLANVLALPLALGAFAAGFACAIMAGYLKENSRVKEDAVLGIVFSGMFAFGLVLFAKLPGDQHLTHILFGNLLGVTWSDVAATAAVALPVAAVVAAKRRDLTLFCFDPAHAQAIGLPVKLLHYGLLALIALTVVAAVKAVGIILVVAMLIAPGATGYVLTRRFGRMMAIAIASAVLATALGVLISFRLDAATGPLIVVVQSAIFWMAVAWSNLRRSSASSADGEAGTSPPAEGQSLA